MATSSSSKTLTPAQEALLPVDKSDYDSVAHIRTLTTNELEPLIPQLLTWLQDQNWPIFRDVRELLLRYPKEIVEPVRGILKGEDGEWIHNCLLNLVADMPMHCQLELRKELERIARNPTVEESEFESEEVAEEILRGLEGDEGQKQKF